MDINMPEMDGIEATKRIRILENETVVDEFKKLPIIALTAADTGTTDLKDQCVALGFDHVIEKPISKKRFQELLCKYLIISE